MPKVITDLIMGDHEYQLVGGQETGSQITLRCREYTSTGNQMPFEVLEEKLSIRKKHDGSYLLVKPRIETATNKKGKLVKRVLVKEIIPEYYKGWPPNFLQDHHEKLTRK